MKSSKSDYDSWLLHVLKKKKISDIACNFKFKLFFEQNVLCGVYCYKQANIDLIKKGIRMKSKNCFSKTEYKAKMDEEALLTIVRLGSVIASMVDFGTYPLRRYKPVTKIPVIAQAHMVRFISF